MAKRSSGAKNPPPVITGPHPGGGWQNKRPHAERASKVTETKAEAEAAGKELAQKQGAEHIIQKKNGQIGERNSYGNTESPVYDKDGKR